MDDKKQNIDTFAVNFGGNHTIEAEMYINTIKNIIELLKISGDISNPGESLALEIKAQKEGSFELVVDVIAKCGPIFVGAINYSTKAIEIFRLLLLIKKHLKGKKAKEVQKSGENCEIKNSDNEVITAPANVVNEFFKNAQIQDCTINIFKDARESCRESISIKHKSDTMEFKSAEYNNMTSDVIDKVEKQITSKEENRSSITFSLKKPDLLGHSAWQFVYQDKTIDAKIEDDVFLNNVHNGTMKTLYAGVQMVCSIRIEHDVDLDLSPIKNSYKYVITKVLKTIEPERDKGLLFDNEV